MIGFTFDLDDREFTHALRDCVKVADRTVEEEIHNRAAWVATKAFRFSPVSDTERIRSQLGQTASILAYSKGRLLRDKMGRTYTRRGRKSILLPGEMFVRKQLKSGKLSKMETLQARASNAPLTLAHRIILKQLWRTAGGRRAGFEVNLAAMIGRTLKARPDVKRRRASGIRRRELDELARKFIATRVASKGYVRAGWLAAMDDAWAMVRIAQGKPGDSKVWLQQDVWGHKRARGAIRREWIGSAYDGGRGTTLPFVIIRSASLGQKDRQHKPDLAKVTMATRALEMAMQSETAEMVRHVRDKLEKALRRFSVR